MANFELPEGFTIDTPEPVEAKFDLPPGFEVDVVEPVIEEPIVETPITIDTSITGEVIEPIPEAISRDVTATEPTSLAIGMDSRQVAEQEIVTETERRKEEALEIQADRPFDASYIDPRSGETITLAPAEPGMEATLAVLDIVGGIQAKAVRGIGTVYEEITEEFLKANKNVEFVNKAVKQFASRKGMSNDSLEKILKGVPENEQALVIANALGEDSTGVIQQAIKHSDDLKTEMNRRIKTRVKDLEAVARIGSVDDVMSAASKNFGDMVTKVQELNIGVESQGILKGIDTTKVLGGADDPIKSKLVSLENMINSQPTQNLSDLLILQKEINSLLRTATGQGEYMLTKAKKNLKDIIDNGTPPELSDLITDTIGNYAMATQNRVMKDIIYNAKNEKGIINYKSLKDKLKKEGVDTYDSKAVIHVLENFEKKFSNDYRVFGLTKGSDTKEGILGLYSEIVSPLKAFFIRWGEYGNDVAMQKQIESSLVRSKTPYEFASNIIRNKDVPQEIRDTFINHIAKIDKTDLSKFEMKEITEVALDLQKKAKQVNISVKTKEQAIDKIQFRLNSLDKSLTAKYDKMLELEEKGKDASGLEGAINDLLEKRAIINKDLELANQKHSLEAEALDTLNVQIESLKGFEVPKIPAKQPKVSRP